MSYIKIWIHAVWTTKNRVPLLEKSIRPTIFHHIKENAKSKDIYIDHINGIENHVHSLISLGGEQSIAKVIGLLKGESSYWINQNKLTRSKFGWQDEYFAVSVSQSHVDIIRQYIRDQEEHHKKKTWEQEYNEFINNYGFQVIKLG